MPELPEVETTVRGIAPHLLAQSVGAVVIRNARLRWPIAKDLPEVLTGVMIQSVVRRAKYILLDCGNGTLLLHLGMSGSLRVLPGNAGKGVPMPEKHDHFDLVLENGIVLRLRDPRRFGAVIWFSGDIAQHPLLQHLGPEPLTTDFNASYLFAKLRASRSSIKQNIMNNRIVVGVGNIYANEALFLSGINPQAAAGSISKPRYAKLVDAIKTVLQAAIEAGGSSLRDFVNSDGKPGYFQQQYWVYGRAGQSCKKCNKTLLQIRQGQRSSFYCPGCQRI